MPDGHPGMRVVIAEDSAVIRGGLAEILADHGALARIAAGGTALDPEVVDELLGANRHASTVAALTVRERDVLRLMAEGRSNSAIADHLGPGGRETSATSSASSGCRHRTPTTAGSSPSSPTSSLDALRLSAAAE